MNKVFTVCFIVFVFGIYSCNTLPKAKQKPMLVSSSLEGEWKLYSSNKIVLHFSKKSYSGFGGCNDYSGTFAQGDEDSLSFSLVNSTDAYCEKASFDESSYLSLLRQVNRYERYTNELLLYKDKILLLKFFKK